MNSNDTGVSPVREARGAVDVRPQERDVDGSVDLHVAGQLQLVVVGVDDLCDRERPAVQVCQLAVERRLAHAASEDKKFGGLGHQEFQKVKG